MSRIEGEGVPQFRDNSLDQSDRFARFVNLLTPTTTPKEFEELIDQELLTLEDKEGLGDRAIHKARRAILYPVVFAPIPATFDEEALSYIIRAEDKYTPDVRLQNEVLTKICLGIGLVELKARGEYIIRDLTLLELLGQILKRY